MSVSSRPRLPALALALASVVSVVSVVSVGGCAPASVEGTVDGEAVAALSSASFIESLLGSEQTGGLRTFVTSTAISVGDGCNVATELQTNRNEAYAALLEETDNVTDLDEVKAANLKFVEAQVDAVKSKLPPTYWTAILSASALDENDLEGGESEIDLDDPDFDQDVQSTLRVCRVNAHPVAGEDSNDFPTLEQDEDCFVAASGDVEIETFIENEQIVANATAKLVHDDDTDEDAGEVVVHISATHCPSLETALADFEEIIE